MKIARLHALPFAAALFFTITQPSCTREAKKVRSLEAALKHYNEGAFSAAEIEYKNALKADPGNPEAIKRLGIIRALQGSSYEAAGILTQAKKKLPKDNEVAINLAKSLLNLGFLPDSRIQLLEVLERAPDNAEALLFLAESSIRPEWMEECDQRIKAAGGKSAAAKLATALLLLRRGSLDEGTALVEEVLKSTPKLARAHALKASILTSRKMPAESLAEMKIAADSAGVRSNESIAYARALMAAKRRDDAVAYLDKLTAATPDFLPAWGMLGQIAYTEKKDETATNFFSKVLSKNPIDVTTALMQAEMWIRTKESAKAVELLEKITNTLPGRPQIDLALAKCLIADEKLTKAAVALDRVLAVSPDLTEAGRMRAMIQMHDGKVADAVTALEAIRRKDPNDPGTRDLLIRAYRSTDRNDDAIVLLREKSGINKDDSQSRIELGQLLSSQGKLDEARSIFENSVETFSGSLEAVSNLAELDIKAGRGDSALKRLEEYLTAHPDSSDAYLFKAGTELNLKKPNLAEQSLTKAIELKPDNARAYALLLQLKSSPGQEKAALAVLERYLKAFPKDLEARLQKGYLLQLSGENDEARKVFVELTVEAPGFASAYNNLASLEADAFHNLESAATHARKARSIDPAHPAIADTLGWIEWQLGNYPAALVLLTEAAAKMETSPGVIYHLGMAHYSMGQPEEATAAFTKALEPATDFPEKADAQKHLSLLRDAGKAAPADLQNLQKRVADSPKDIMSWLQLADLQTRSDQPQEALESYQKALAVNPAIPSALVGEARLYGGPLKSPEKALAPATKARELAPRDPTVLAALGFAKLLTGAHEEAYGLLKDASVSLENNSTVVSDYARAAYSLGRISEARTAMTRVAASDTAISNDAKQFLALTDAEAAKNPAIATEVEKSLTRDPDFVPALMLRGSLETAAGKSPEATYQKILTLQPRFDPARVRLAAFYIEDPAKLDQALSLARAARTNMGEDQELTRIVAIINYRKGDFKYAAQLLAELATKRPLVSDELLVLGLSLANSNQPEKARLTLADALTSGLSDKEVAQAKAALSKLDHPDERK